MKISVAMIVLNEEKNILPCLKSLTFADEIIIIDGGSEDKTRDLILNLQDPRIKLFVNPWQGHFGVQRDTSFKYCTGSWIMRVDADEIVGRILRREIRSVLVDLDPSVQNVRIRQVNLHSDRNHYAANLGGFETWPRIFRNREDLRWVGRVHEFVNGSEKNCINWSVAVYHFGWLDKEKYYQKGEMYSKIPGSGFSTPEELVNREYIVKSLPRVGKGRLW